MNIAQRTVVALEQKLDEIKRMWDKEERDALLENRTANFGGLNEAIVRTEDQLESVRDQAAWEADEPRRQAEFVKADADLYERAVTARARIADAVSKLVAELEAAKELGATIQMVSVDKRGGPSGPMTFFRADSKFRGVSWLAILRGGTSTGGMHDAIKQWQALASEGRTR